MPLNFPELWQNRIETNLTQSDQAPWLDGIEELDVQVTELGSSSLSEQNIIHIPTTDFEPDVLINNSAYPLALQSYTDAEVIISLDKYQTKPVSLRDDQIIGASYNKIDAATGAIVQALLKKKYAKAIHAIAPISNTADTPIVVTSGTNDGLGRKRMVYNDLVALKAKFDIMEIPAVGRRLVLSSDHWNDLLLDRDRFGDNFANYRAGQIAPVVAGFEMYQYVANPHFDGTNATKKAFGATPVATDFRASVAFYTANIAKKTGLTKQYFSDAQTNPEEQTNKLAYRHYFIAVPKRKKYIGAIASAKII